MTNRKQVSTAIDRIARKCRIDSNLVEDAYPCTSLQAALVAASLQGLADYVSRFVFDISDTAGGPTSVKAAFAKVFEQHSILRSRVIENGGQFLQVVTTEPLVWRAANDLQQYLAEDREQTTVFGQPLAAFACISESSGKSYMVWSLHHCQYDEWSFKLMTEDLNRALSTSVETDEEPRRVPLSKFVKALDKIDDATSHNFWKEKLRNFSEPHRICGNVPQDTSFRTSERLQNSYTIDLSSDTFYQPSVLAVAAWSLIVGHLSKSQNVMFGHVLSGRAFELDGIQEVCGPTLTTVPWGITISSESTVKGFLDHLQELRAQVLPFEQTGLGEYRKLVGVANFDTMLSVRASQDKHKGDGDASGLQPEKLDVIDLNHPCCVFFEVDMSGTECILKASYDERWIEPKLLSEAMEKFISAVETLPLKLETDLESFEESLQLPETIEKSKLDSTSRPGHPPNDHEDVNPKVLAKVQKLAIKTAGVEDQIEVGPETTMMQLGMDSLKNIVLSRNLSKQFNVSIPFKEIAGSGRSLLSIGRSVERALQGSADTSSKLSLLDLAEGYAKGLSPVTEPIAQIDRENEKAESAILLTGATGYLGIELLRYCLSSTTAKIVLLVRCASASDGLDRVVKAAKMASWKQDEIDMLQNRTHVWPADLSKDQLGLDSEHWNMLMKPNTYQPPLRFQAIIHNGAKVDFVRTYADLEVANVQSTATLLDLHLKLATKPNFVFVTGGRPCPLTPDAVEDTAAKLATAGGYAQTKFVSEVLVHKTRALYKEAGRKVHMSIVHPGSIIGSASTGVANTDDYIWRYVAASLGMGCYVPAVPTKREWINLTPVDVVAETIVSRAVANTSPSEDMSDAVERCLVRSGLPISQFWAAIVDLVQEIKPKPISEAEWLIEFEADVNEKGQEQPLFALSQLLLEGHLKGIGGLPPKIDSRTGTGPETASVDKALRSNVRYLLDKDFFSATKQSSGVFARSSA